MESAMLEHANEDVGNIVLLEHVNLQVPDQALATLFYMVGLGLTRDPYFNIGVRNMWANAGEQQLHLPIRPAQVLHGHIGVVVPDLESLKERLASIHEPLAKTKFSWTTQSDHVAVTCPWGNTFHCYAPNPSFGDMALGIPYVEFIVERDRANAIARFYDQVLAAPAIIENCETGTLARVKIGRNQSLVFRESDQPRSEYDGHHIAIYVANFSRPYAFLKARGLITEEVRNHQFRFKQLVDPGSNRPLFLVEHEVRSLHHPMFHRVMVNRDPNESARRYRRGRDGLNPYN
jgi:catechol 2,3-dioxygenase-like lactoylglutathione lyase family enzyme